MSKKSSPHLHKKPIPAFYCCYLLRSTVRHASLYVGSTPSPLRRLSQHNGHSTGGAVRTSRPSLRPWEMTCIVSGFTSSIAALQFEWAWQNAHLTRHISADERISFATTRTKTSLKTGQTRKRPGRPPSSLTEKLSNLHLLLRVEYFSKWPLEVRFFSEEVYRVWQTWCQRVDGQVRPGIGVFLDIKKNESKNANEGIEQPQRRKPWPPLGDGGIEGIDSTYGSVLEQLEKGRFVFDEEEQLLCGVCEKELKLDQDLITLCYHGECRSLSHVTCLAKKFLQENDSLSPIPSVGKCPDCATELKWVDLMKHMSLRTRSEAKVRKLLKTKRNVKLRSQMGLSEAESDDDSDSDNGEEEEELDTLTFADAVDEEEDDAMSTTSADSPADLPAGMVEAPNNSTAPRPLEVVIEDSDDEVEILSMP